MSNKHIKFSWPTKIKLLPMYHPSHPKTLPPVILQLCEGSPPSLTCSGQGPILESSISGPIAGPIVSLDGIIFKNQTTSHSLHCYHPGPRHHYFLWIVSLLTGFLSFPTVPLQLVFHTVARVIFNEIIIFLCFKTSNSFLLDFKNRVQSLYHDLECST